MGLCASSPTDVTPQQKNDRKVEERNNAQIERANEQDKEHEMQVTKLLLLGAGESGKSTFYKQVVDLYGNGFSEEDINNHISLTHINTISSMKMICEAAKRFEEFKLSGSNEEIRDKLLLIEDNTVLDAEIAQWVKTLWADPAIKETWLKKRNLIQVPESASYFFANVDRYSRKDFTPTKQDMLHVRMRTTGILETLFKIDQSQFKLVDVGGQRSERKKWINCFSGVNAVLFVAAISEYDQKIWEDDATNRIEESLTIFEDITTNELFAQTALILFLNKKDLFEEKIKRVPLSTVYDDYKGDDSFKAGVDYMKEKFLARNKSDRTVYVHVTCATDDQNVMFVFMAVRDSIVRKVLGSQGVF